jgi:hypothetical protein
MLSLLVVVILKGNGAYLRPINDAYSQLASSLLISVLNIKAGG